VASNRIPQDLAFHNTPPDDQRNLPGASAPDALDVLDVLDVLDNGGFILSDYSNINRF